MSFGAIGNITPANPVGFLTPIGPREINEVPLDVVIEETISHTVVVTEHPIEISTSDGVSRGTIADNAFVAPTVYTMRGGVSDTPISWRSFRSAQYKSYANTFNKTRSLSAYDLLYKEHFLRLIPFTLRTPFGDLEDMIFRTFTIHRDQSTKSAIIFSAEFYQLNLVDTISAIPIKTSEIMEGPQAQTQAVDPVDRGVVAPIEIP